MKLVPKRKLISLTGEDTLVPLIQHIQNITIDEISTGGTLDLNRLWVKYRLRIPVGTDMFD